MNTWQTLGDYLERRVKCTDLASNHFASLSSDDNLLTAIVLVVFGFSTTQLEVKRWIDGLADQFPLAIIVAGDHPEFAFDYLLHSCSTRAQDLHIMTGMADSNEPPEVVEQFLTSTWPSEERFDAWESYAVVLVGCSGLVRLSIEAAIGARTDK